jgi:hypothetical protein
LYDHLPTAVYSAITTPACVVTKKPPLDVIS